MSEILSHYEKYNQKTGHYFLEWFKGSSRHLMFENWLKENVKPGSKVLDIGCGDGSFAEWMPQYKWTGLDIGASEKAYKGEWIKTDLEATPYAFKDESFDAIICSEVLEHLFSPEKVSVEAYRLLKKRGIYAISTPNFNWVDHMLKGWAQVLYAPKKATHTKEHIRFYDVSTHLDMLKESGFVVADVMGADPQWGEFFRNSRWELKKALPEKTDGEVDYLLGKMFPYHMHTIGLLAVKG